MLSPNDDQQPLLQELPANKWDEKAAQRSLDELFIHARQYKSSNAYESLIGFCSRFRFYSPYNAMLINIQMPGATFAAPANRWKSLYKRTIKPGARPLVILQPMGPVMFIFDVADTLAGQDSIALPREVEEPFEIFKGDLGQQLEKTLDNAKRDGIRITMTREGSQSAGSIGVTKEKKAAMLDYPNGKDENGNQNYIQIPVRYDLLCNEKLSREARYATMVHELSHLYCGHLGTPNEKWWPDRRGLHHTTREFEAESVTYLICARIGIDNPSAAYLANYVKANEEVPDISLDRVLKAAGLIEQMGLSHLKPRKAKD